MTTWAYNPDSHPWFRSPSLKRKTLDDDDISIVEYQPTRPITLRTKRRRCHNIEHGLAQMSLDPSFGRSCPTQSLAGSVTEQSLAPPQSFYGVATQNPSPQGAFSPLQGYGSSAAPSSVTLPASVEEPTSPNQQADIPDVQMKPLSWYEVEKDRIVITDLEDSDVEDQGRTAATVETEYIVSPVLLDRLPKPVPVLSMSTFSDSDASKALVLFRPLVISQDQQQEATVPADGLRRDSVDITQEAPEMDVDAIMVDDAMDITPL